MVAGQPRGTGASGRWKLAGWSFRPGSRKTPIWPMLLRLMTYCVRWMTIRRAVLLAAHNPGLQELALELVPDDGETPLFDEIMRKYPTAAFAVFELDIEHWARFAAGLRQAGAFRPASRSRSGAGAGKLIAQFSAAASRSRMARNCGCEFGRQSLAACRQPAQALNPSLQDQPADRLLRPLERIAFAVHQPVNCAHHRHILRPVQPPPAAALQRA